MVLTISYKKNMKMYKTPEMDITELKLQNGIATANLSNPSENGGLIDGGDGNTGNETGDIIWG